MIRAERCQAGDVRHILAAIPSAKTDRDGLFDVGQIAASGDVYRIVQDGQAVAAYVMEWDGLVAWVTAFGGRAGVDLVAVLVAVLDRQAERAYEVRFRTERRGLVRKVLRHGYEVLRQDGAAYYMRKKMRHVEKLI